MPIQQVVRRLTWVTFFSVICVSVDVFFNVELLILHLRDIIDFPRSIIDLREDVSVESVVVHDDELVLVSGECSGDYFINPTAGSFLNHPPIFHAAYTPAHRTLLCFSVSAKGFIKFTQGDMFPPLVHLSTDQNLRSNIECPEKIAACRRLKIHGFFSTVNTIHEICTNGKCLCHLNYWHTFLSIITHTQSMNQRCHGRC